MPDRSAVRLSSPPNDVGVSREGAKDPWSKEEGAELVWWSWETKNMCKRMRNVHKGFAF